MGYNLTIDQGNSAAKVVVWCDNNFVAVSHYSTFSDSEIRELANQYPIENAIYCSVGNAETQVVESLRNFAKGIVLELSHTTPMPLILDYATPQTLGRDRIAAAMGAYDKFRGNTILVVDIGTAVTYDVVTADGHFAGGNIAPGVKMRLDAMHHFTARLPQVEIDGKSALWGIDTVSAMRAGALNGVVAEIEYYHARMPQNTVVALTGGSASHVAQLLNLKVEVIPHLVNEGLNCILRYNETK